MWEICAGLSFVGAVIGIILAKARNPDLATKCIFGFHDYCFSHEKHGMHFENYQLVGTERNIYMCRCGKEKPAEKGDWNNTY